jgi:hypothetical protein
VLEPLPSMYEAPGPIFSTGGDRGRREEEVDTNKSDSDEICIMII